MSTIGTADTRYQYVGQHGYETFADLPYQHVGARWYDPSTGRFLQRDPIGIHGGMNVFEYISNAPTFATDASGLASGDFWDRLDENMGRGGNVGALVGGFVGGVAGGISGSGIPGAGTVAGAGIAGLAGSGAGYVVGQLCGGGYTIGEEFADGWQSLCYYFFAKGTPPVNVPPSIDHGLDLGGHQDHRPGSSVAPLLHL
ncbi:MAG: hypothetical protein HOP29_19000 [Phycisphaerales bacterium]|nr:hypothetical protein [Phycisphaerales bacterium]